jgi:hypothetical protein
LRGVNDGSWYAANSKPSAPATLIVSPMVSPSLR